jgi:hypothetical protein
MLRELFYFLTGLPEKEVWRDRGAKECNESSNFCLVEIQFRNKSVPSNVAPRHFDNE